MGREKAKTFQELVVWQNPSVCYFCLSNYLGFSKQRDIWLDLSISTGCGFNSSQHSRSFKKTGKPDKFRFMNIAQGSLEECRYYLILAQDLGYSETSNLMSQAEEVSKLLDAYAKAILNSGS